MTWVAVSLASVLMNSGQAGNLPKRTETQKGKQQIATAVSSKWEGRLFVAEEEKRERQRVRAQAIRLGQAGLRRMAFPVMDTTSRNTESLDEFIKSRIRRMEDVCELTPKQTKKLQLAGKGAAHRIRQTKKVNPTIQINGREFTVRTRRNHGSDLEAQSIWSETVKKTLTEAQLKKWKKRLPSIQMPRSVRRLWELNQSINARIITVDPVRNR